jgi:hypothetical protein
MSRAIDNNNTLYPINSRYGQTSNCTLYDPSSYGYGGYGGYGSYGGYGGYGQDIPIGPMYSGNNNYSGYDSNMEWYYQNIAPGMNDVTNVYNQAMRTSANFGFNADNVNAGTNKDALQTFRDMLNDPNGPGGSDGILVKSEAEDALKNNTHLTAKQKAALDYLLHQPQNSSGMTLWDTLDGADGVVSNKDVEPGLQGNLDPNSLTNDCLTPYK